MKPIRHSYQRDEILNYLCSSKEHPTAEQIYAAVRETFPNISLGTVYRNLAQLEEFGMIRSVSCGHDAVRFDANTSAHHHFVCSKCGAVIDVTLKKTDLASLASPGLPCSITDYDIVFHGLCESCSKKKAAAADNTPENI